MAGRAPGGLASVVMVAYRTGPALAESLSRALAEPAAHELVLVDNGSTPEEAALADRLAAEHPERLKLIRGHGNVGFARGANLGARAAKGEVLVFLNPDAFLEPGCIAALTEALDARAPPVLVGARVMDVEGREQRGARRGEFTLSAALLNMSGLVRLKPFRRFELHHERDPLPEGPVPTPTVSGACFAMTAEGFAVVHGFDEGFFLHVEDVDLCWRVRQMGGEVLFHPGARVVHLGSTSKKAPVVVEFWKGLGLARYFRKRADTPQRMALAWLLGPLIVLVSVARPILRGQMFNRRPAAPTG